MSIETGLNDGTKTEVLAGLKDDEVVVKAYTPSLTDGQPVESVQPAKTQATPAKL